MKSKLILVLILFLTVSTFSQTMTDMKYCATFIYKSKTNGAFVANGTGFFVGVTDTVKKLLFNYLVTARHVLWDSATKSFPKYTWIREEQHKGGPLVYVRIPLVLSGLEQNTFIHSDSTVDLIAINRVIDVNKYKYMIVPIEVFATSEHLKQIGIEEGEDILMPALFAYHLGTYKNYPVIRSGKLALLSEGERINWDGQLQRLHLVESISIGGHSGAPVFIRYNRIISGEGYLPIEYAKKAIRFLGVMEGYFRNWNALKIANTSLIPVSESHTGISAVVPAELLLEILMSQEAITARNRFNLK